MHADSWKMEEHMEKNESVEPFKCNICEKGFYVKWRLDKHIGGHSDSTKFRHYFNNGQPCPFEKVGWKFKHEVSYVQI